MKVYFLPSAKVVKRFETARKSVRNLCAPQQTQCVTAKKSTAPRICSNVLGAGGPRFESWYPDTRERHLKIKHLRKIVKCLFLRFIPP